MFKSLERGEGESFDEYKKRRAEAHQAARKVALKTRGGSRTSRQMRRHPAPIMVGGVLTKVKPARGNYGRDLLAHFASPALAKLANRKPKPVPLAEAA
jgi:hypothetical protein